MTHRLRRLAAAAGVATMLTFTPYAAAAPESGDAGTISLSDLGASSTIWFDTRGETSITTFSFSVPKGLTPSRLNATLEVPVALRSGYVAVTQNSKTVNRQPLPTQDGAKLVIPLSDAKVFDGWMRITLTVVALAADDRFCWESSRAPIRLVDSSVTFTGTAKAPGTVAEFLPPTLAKLTIGVPMKPSLAESEAAVQLAAAMAKRYGWQGTDIAVVPITGGADTLPPAGPRERQIVVTENPDKGLTLLPQAATPVLLITGPGPELTNQTRLLSDPSLEFALSTKAVAGDLASDDRPAQHSTTLEQLRQTGTSAESLRPQVEIKVDQTIFAEPVLGIRVHLLGSYTPLPSNYNGEILAQIGDDVVDRWPVDAQGTIDRWIDIPNHLVQRSTYLTIKEHTTGDLGYCSERLNGVLRIDPKTEIQVNRASPPVPPGFRSLPQALMPVVKIGIEPGSAIDTVRAAKIMMGLQLNSGLPLTVELASLQDAIASRESAVLISANSWKDQSFALPFSADLGRITIEGLDPGGKSTTLTLDPAIKWGSLQTLFDGQRSLLIATSNGAPAQLDELLRWLGEEPGRWGDLEGRAIISVPYNAPVTVPNPKVDLATDQQDKGGLANAGWPWLVASGIAAAAVVGAVLILLRSRKPRTVAARGSKKAHPEGEYHEHESRPGDEE